MISAILLAAGTASRMNGRNKLLLPFNGKTSLLVIVENILAAGIDEVIIVTGHEAEKIEAHIKHLPVRTVWNYDFAKGMTTSIQKGISVANGDGYMICLADMPLITSEEYLQLKTFFEASARLNPACICVPTHQAQQGNPVIFSSSYRDVIMRHSDMTGCKQILKDGHADIYRIEMPGSNILTDFDTPEEFLSAVEG